eukprot:XP_001708403.1 Hypothetical protein GL50803_35498 [Giardia lamblia ATCC 50803]
MGRNLGHCIGIQVMNGLGKRWGKLISCFENHLNPLHGNPQIFEATGLVHEATISVC